MVIKISEKMSFLVLLHEVRGRIIKISISVLIIAMICMTMGITMIDFSDYHIPIPYLTSRSNISIEIITFMKNTLLPKNVSLIQIVPGQAFTAQIYVAIIVGIIVTMPVIFREIITFLGPALHIHEKRIIEKIIFPSIILFTAGCFFSYYIVIPYTIEFLYKYGQSMEVVSFFDITQFISFVINLLILFGLTYQLPLIMWALTKTGVVKSRFWRNNFRYAIVILIILGAFITPDGSGITMWFITGPMLLLYIVGIFIVETKFSKIVF
jgi:sec-independent protein translocase protein TatC